MTEKKIRCDACGADAVEIRYDFERVRDAAGGTDTEYKTVDLCIYHLQDALQCFLRETPAGPAQCAKEFFGKWVSIYCTWQPKAK